MEDALIVLATTSPLFAAVAGFFAAAWWSSSRHVRRLESLLGDKIDNERRDDSLERVLASIEDRLDRVHQDQELLARVVDDTRARGLISPVDQAPTVVTPT